MPDEAFVDPFGKVQSLFTIKSVPVTILIDKTSQVIQCFDGLYAENMKAIEAILKEKKE